MCKQSVLSGCQNTQPDAAPHKPTTRASTYITSTACSSSRTNRNCATAAAECFHRRMLLHSALPRDGQQPWLLCHTFNCLPTCCIAAVQYQHYM